MEAISEKIYPGVFDRVKAVFVDSVVIIIFMVIITDIFSSFENVPGNARIIAFIFIFCLYDPLCTSIFGGTLGHILIGLRVRREKHPEKNISFPMAFIRYITKAALGWISLFTVLSNEKRQAIHDYIASSIIIYDQYKNTNDKNSLT
ncbi:RDD family protein [Aquimarina sp. 2201CG5-10]|uniref:RDD family protein n=1 Tax=Aquimarina callyspongiae TaxID=3098150 RepID=UPI002AB4554B|nr:RDD family protein [Aquimarina sp. 2201CG5-10]MDY8135585.1 RDD family protein [Aquimarina sp. 2201CG5-10]